MYDLAFDHRYIKEDGDLEFVGKEVEEIDAVIELAKKDASKRFPNNDFEEIQYMYTIFDTYEDEDGEEEIAVCKIEDF